jgi:hypothetical protein
MRIHSTKNIKAGRSLWKKIRRSRTWEALAVNLASTLPYESGKTLLSHLFSSEILQSLLFHETLERLRTIETWVGRPIDMKQAVARNIFANACWNWRLLAIGNMSWERATQSIKVNGFDILEQHREQQPGKIIIYSHFGAARVTSKLLSQNGFPLTIVARRNITSKFANFECPLVLTESLLPIQIIRESAEAIEAGPTTLHFRRWPERPIWNRNGVFRENKSLSYRVCATGCQDGSSRHTGVCTGG